MNRIAILNIGEKTVNEITFIMNDDYKEQVVILDKNDIVDISEEIMILITTVDFFNEYNHIINDLIETKSIPVIILNNNVRIINNLVIQSPLLFIMDKGDIKSINLFINQLIKTSNYIKHIKTELKNSVKELNLYKKTYKAKVLLMKYEGFTEHQAHQYITKKSMERRLSKEKIINEIVNKYNKY